MVIFIDTSAFLAILNEDDKNHLAARKLWNKLLDSENVLISNNYVLVESFAPYTTATWHGSSQGVPGRYIAVNKYRMD